VIFLLKTVDGAN